MKKILAMVLSVAIIATLAISGTVAYFTDTESEVNVFTVGKVDIELLEEQRSADNSKLEKFEDGKNLMPLVDFSETHKGVQSDNKDKWGLPDSSVIKNYVDKIVRVKNTGESEAWVRIFYGVPTALEGEVDNAGDDVLHTNMGNRFDPDGTSKYNTGAWAVAGNEYYDDFGAYKTDNPQYRGVQEINGIEYNIWCYTMIHKFEKDDTSAAILTGLYLDEDVDYNDVDGYYYMGSKDDPAHRITIKGIGAKDGSGEYYERYDLGNGVYIPVFAEAVQCAGFEDAETAFATAIEKEFREIHKDDDKQYNPWYKGVADFPGFVTVSSLEDLKSAIAKYDDVRITLDADIEDIEEQIVIPKGTNVTLNMNGKTMSLKDGADGNTCDPMVNVKNGASLTIDGNGTFDLGANPGFSLMYPFGDVTINSGTFKIDSGLSSYGSFFVGISGGTGKLIINGGYFDGGYYVEGDCFNNCRNLLNGSWGQYVRVYGGTFVGQNPAWGDEGMCFTCPHCTHTPGTGYCQTIFLEGQSREDTTIPAAYTITEGTTTDGTNRPTYTVTYTKSV